MEYDFIYSFYSFHLNFDHKLTTSFFTPKVTFFPGLYWLNILSNIQNPGFENHGGSYKKMEYYLHSSFFTLKLFLLLVTLWFPPSYFSTPFFYCKNCFLCHKKTNHHSLLLTKPSFSKSLLNCCVNFFPNYLFN